MLPSPRRRPSLPAMGFLTVSGLALAGLLLLVVFVETGPHGPMPEPEAGAVEQPAAVPELPAGSRVTIARPGGAGHAILARDEAAFEIVAAGRSLREFTALREAGRLWRVPNGATARVIDSKADRVRVRLADATDGWVERRYVEEKRD
jgi:hypothetical protein